MSHFCCVVIGDDVESQLQPYHEYECTGHNDQYVIDVPVTEEELADGRAAYEAFKERQPEESKDVTEAQYLLNDWGGWTLGEDGTYVRHTNPDAKWDWWTIGGRWGGFFQLLDPTDPADPEASTADQALKGEIDFVGPKLRAEADASALFDRLEHHMKGIEPSTILWQDVLERHLEEYAQEQAPPDLDDAAESEWYQARRSRMDAARDEWQALPYNKALQEFMKNEGIFVLWESPESYFKLDHEDPRLAFVTSASSGKGTPFAFVYNGQWYERGQMGMFGMSNETEDESEAYDRVWQETLDSLPLETQLTLVDCHI